MQGVQERPPKVVMKQAASATSGEGVEVRDVPVPVDNGGGGEADDNAKDSTRDDLACTT